MSRVLLDTSILIGGQSPGPREGAISAASLAELHFGVLVAADDPDEQARRAQRLGVIEATFEPLPVDAPVAREWGRLAAAVARRGGQPRRRAVDLVIAATANVHGVPLLTADSADLALIDDLVTVEVPRLTSSHVRTARATERAERRPASSHRPPHDTGAVPPAVRASRRTLRIARASRFTPSSICSS